jgi:predicted RecA/RadA family phage recombinase
VRGTGETIEILAESGITAGQVIQLKDGRAGYAKTDITSGHRGEIQVSGLARIAKTSGLVFLSGGEVCWDHSANALHYKNVDDRDFVVGTAVGDWASGETYAEVALNERPRYLIDILRDAYRSVIVGTQALGGLAIKRNGGCLNMLLSATSEAQKLDALSVAGFAIGANAIVEIIFAIVQKGGDNAVDVSLGVANGTHASDADSIGESAFLHLNSNDLNLYFESDDGTTDVPATDSTDDATEGAAVSNLVHVWMDFRDPADVQMYLNAVNKLPATTFTLNAATGPLKLLAHIEKTAATGIFELDLHALRVRIAEQ